MKSTIPASLQLAPLIIYVAGIDSRPDNFAAVCDAAYGIYYDSARMSGFNFSDKFHHEDELSGGNATAVYRGMIEVLHDAPQGHSIIIESESKWQVHQLHRASHRRNTGADPSKRYENAHEKIILDLIDFRTSKGDCTVEIHYSAKDPAARKGFRGARALARKALAGSSDDD